MFLTPGSPEWIATLDALADRLDPASMRHLVAVAGGLWLPAGSEVMALGARPAALRRLQFEARNAGLLGPAAVRAVTTAVERVAEWFP